MKHTRLLLAVAVGLLVSPSAHAITFLTDQFSTYIDGRLGDAGIGGGGTIPGWNTPQNEITVTNTKPSLDGTSLGLVASLGSRVSIFSTNISNGSYNRFAESGFFRPDRPTNIYSSFLYRFNSSNITNGTWITGMNRQNSGITSLGTFSWMLIAKESGGNLQLGLTRPGGTLSTNYAAASIAPGQTFFVVVRQIVITNATTPDQIDLWINPAASFFGTNEANIPAADATTSDGVDDTSNTGPGRFWITSFGQSAEMDEVRIANTWAEATPPVGQCLTAGVATSPTNLTQVAEISASFRVVPSGTAPAIQWQVSTDGGTVWNNISGANASTYNTPNLALSASGTKYRAIVNVPCNASSATSAVATVTLTAPVVTPTGIIMNDTFLDPDLGFDDRSNLPLTSSNSVWYTAAALTDNLTAFNQSGNLLGIPVTAASSLWLGFFTETNQPPVHLGVGNTIKVTLPFIANAFSAFTNNAALRFGLFDYADGGTRPTADSATLTGSQGNGINVRGYMFSLDWGTNFSASSPLSLLVRNGIGDINLMGTTGDYISMGSGPAGGGYTNAPAFKPGEQYTLEFSITRSDVSVVNFAVLITGAGTNWAHSATETNFSYHRFDAFAIRPNSLETSADSFSFGSFKVEVTAPTFPNSINISSVSRTGNDVTLNWSPTPGGAFTYTVLRSTDLNSGTWATLQTGISTLTYTDTTATTSNAFYRVRSP